MNTNDNAINSAIAIADEIEQWFTESKDWIDASMAERERLPDPDESKPEPLSILVRDDWRIPHTNARKSAVEYELLMTTGGPAARIVGDLNDYGDVTSATIQCQDWFTKWATVALNEKQNEALLAYAASFYFAENN